MAIAATDLLIKGSSSGATAGNATANGGAGTNLGKYCSSGTLTDASTNNLFPDVTGAENASSNVDYQCFFIHNNHASLDAANGVIYISSEVSGGVSCAVGGDATGASPVGQSGTAQAVTVANKNTAPSGVTFTTATTAGAGQAFPGDASLAHGKVLGVWVKRTAANSAAKSGDGVTVGFQIDTPA